MYSPELFRTLRDQGLLPGKHELTLAAAEDVKRAAHSCDRELRSFRDGWAMSGYRQEGERWQCSCGRVYVHRCEEAEGRSWVLLDEDGSDIRPAL